MNQILSTNENKNNKKPVDTTKVIVVFCIIIITFGAIILGKSLYELYKERPKDATVEKLNKPEIAIEQMEDGKIRIVAKYDQGLTQLSYIWNETNKTDINLEGQTYIEKLIDLPEGAINKLEVIAIGTDAQTENFIREFEQQGDTINPEIDWVISTKLKIMATDETELAYVSYKWSEEEETIIKPTTDLKTIEETIEIKRGTNSLTIKAVDTSGNIATKTRTFQGINEPEITWRKYGNIVAITVVHDMGFEKITLIINGKETVYDENSSEYDLSQTEIILKAPIQVGENTIVVKAKSKEGSEKKLEGKTTYNPQ